MYIQRNWFLSFIVAIAAPFLEVVSADESVVEDPEIGTFFRASGTTGTLIVASLKGEGEFVWNAKRATERFLPASTFKIPNALILLEEKALRDRHEIIEWDGTKHGSKQWDRNHNLDTAFEFSCVWFYRKAAGRLSHETYASQLKQIGYGNQKLSAGFTGFWLDNSLKISAREQITFLKQLCLGNLEFSKQTIADVKDIMIEEKTETFVLRAKTGWGRVDGQSDVGWWVGWVETKKDVWFFAMNMLIGESVQAKLRKEITTAALRAKGILPEK